MKQNDIIINFTKQINNDLNPCILFMQTQTEEANTNLHTSKLYDRYKKWFSNNYPNEKLISNRGFINNIRSKYKTYDNLRMPNVSYQMTGLINIKFKDIDIDVSNNDLFID